jgi:hypothetical protein
MGHISEFANHWEVGTPEHGAVHDFLNLQRLYERFGQEQPDFFDHLGNEAAMTPEHRAARDVQKIAILEHTIEQKQASLPGYADAYMDLGLSFSELMRTAKTEAEAKFPTVEEQTDSVKQIYTEIMDMISGTIFDKQNQNLDAHLPKGSSTQ